jgi:hypothetical protein
VQEKGLALRRFSYPSANIFCGVLGLIVDGCQRGLRGLAVVHFPVWQKPPETVQENNFCIRADGDVYVGVVNTPVNAMQVAHKIIWVRCFLDGADQMFCFYSALWSGGFWPGGYK